LTTLVDFQRFGARVRHAVRDALVVIAAFALLGAQALSTLHYVLVPHHLCAEHGVLEDGGARAKASLDKAAPTTDSIAANASDDQDDHEACSLATRHEHGVLLERPALQLAPSTVGALVSSSSGVALKPTRAALLSSAPKTSPPARA
jgi:hypothetical protein